MDIELIHNIHQEIDREIAMMPYKLDWRGALLAIGSCVMVVLCVIAIMLTIAGVI